MRNKSDLALAAIMIAFFGFVVYKLPTDGPTGNFEENLTQSVSTFAGKLAADYNSSVPAGGVITTDGLNEIMPAAGDTAPANAAPVEGSGETLNVEPVPAPAAQ